jgi:hypothetical protein
MNSSISTSISTKVPSPFANPCTLVLPMLALFCSYTSVLLSHVFACLYLNTMQTMM